MIFPMKIYHPEPTRARFDLAQRRNSRIWRHVAMFETQLPPVENLTPGKTVTPGEVLSGTYVG